MADIKPIDKSFLIYYLPQLFSIFINNLIYLVSFLILWVLFYTSSTLIVETTPLTTPNCQHVEAAMLLIYANFSYP